VRLAFAILTIFANITIFMAAVMYAGGLALSGFFGWPLLWCIVGTGIFAGGWAVYGGLNTVAWTGVLTAIVKIGGVTLLTILALKAMTPSGGIIDGFTMSSRRISATAVSGSRRWTPAPASHRVWRLQQTYRVSSRRTIPDPWTGTFFGFLAVGVWYGVMNQFIVQRVLGARDIWHARMGMVMAGYAKLFLPLIIVLPGLILFARHPEFMLSDWATANHRPMAALWCLVREFFPVGLRGLLLAVLICAVQATVSSVVNATCRDSDLRYLCAADQQGGDGKTEGPLRHLGFGSRDHCRHRHGHRHQQNGFRHLSVYADHQCAGGAAFAAILWVGLLWKRTNGAGAIASIIAGFATGLGLKLIGYLWVMPAWFYPFGNQAPVCLLISVLACILGTLAHPAPTPGTDPEPVTFWNSGETLRAGLGDKWYKSVVAVVRPFAGADLGLHGDILSALLSTGTLP
jgi:SSS family solute:Na+ symporter